VIKKGISYTGVPNEERGRSLHKLTSEDARKRVLSEDVDADGRTKDSWRWEGKKQTFLREGALGIGEVEKKLGGGVDTNTFMKSEFCSFILGAGSGKGRKKTFKI